MYGITMPWRVPPLDEWAICGMNHYHVNGKRFLFVSMTKDNKCITNEGIDNFIFWQTLAAKVTMENNND